MKFITSYEFRNDTMFLRNQFKSVGMFRLPLVKKQEISLEDVNLIGYDKVNYNTRQDACTCRERRNIWSDCRQTLVFALITQYVLTICLAIMKCYAELSRVKLFAMESTLMR